MADAVLVEDVEVRRRRRGQLVEDRPADAARVVVQRDDRARVDAGRAQQLVAVLARSGHRPLVRQDARRPGRTPRDGAGRRSRAGSRGDVRAGHAVGLLVDVDRRMRVLVERPVRAPRRQRPGRPPIAVVGLVAGLLARAGRGGRRWPGDAPAAARARPDRSRRTAAPRRGRGRRRSNGRSEGRGTGGSRARDLTKRHDANGSGTVASYDSRRSDASARATFDRAKASLLRPRPAPTSPWGARAPSPAHATQLPGRPPRRSGSRRSSAVLIGALGPHGTAGRGRGRPDDGGPGPARWPRPGRLLGGDRGPPQERRPADHGELRLAGGTQGQTRFCVAVDLPTQADKTFVLYAQPPAFGNDLKVDARGRRHDVATAKAAFTHPRRHPAGRRPSSPSTPSGSSAASTCRPTRTRSRRSIMQPRPRTTCPNGSRRGPRSTGSSGRTSTPTG